MKIFIFSKKKKSITEIKSPKNTMESAKDITQEAIGP